MAAADAPPHLADHHCITITPLPATHQQKQHLFAPPSSSTMAATTIFLHSQPPRILHLLAPSAPLQQRKSYVVQPLHGQHHHSSVARTCAAHTIHHHGHRASAPATHLFVLASTQPWQQHSTPPLHLQHVASSSSLFATPPRRATTPENTVEPPWKHLQESRSQHVGAAAPSAVIAISISIASAETLILERENALPRVSI